MRYRLVYQNLDENDVGIYVTNNSTLILVEIGVVNDTIKSVIIITIIVINIYNFVVLRVHMHNY